MDQYRANCDLNKEFYLLLNSNKITFFCEPDEAVRAVRIVTIIKLDRSMSGSQTSLKVLL